jgi:hypothetical protein
LIERPRQSSERSDCETGEQLLTMLETLETLQDRPPFFCELEGENGFDLIVGVFSDQYSPNYGNGPYMVAVAPDSGVADLEFLMRGMPIPWLHGFCCRSSF